jgi:hypothetical protein
MSQRRHLGYFESKPIHEAIRQTLDRERVKAQDFGAHAGYDLESVDWEVADAAYRWAAALREELSPGPARLASGTGVRNPVVEENEPVGQPVASERKAEGRGRNGESEL